jgi:branched-chain amino acid transport system substrate-binding protein
MSRFTYRGVIASAVALATAAGLGLTGLSTGAAGAATTPGVTATSVRIGATVPLTGIAAPGYSEVAKAANAVFKWVNAHGKINGRSINFVIKDDCYGTPGFGCKGNPNTSQDTQQLISLPVFATVGSLGTPTQAPERKPLKAAGVPQLFVNSGSTDWNAPKTYPMLFGWQQSYQTESMILGQYIKANYHGQKLCFLGQDDDFGHNGYAGLTYEGVTPTAADTSYYNVAQLVITSGASIAPYIAKFQTDSCKVVFLDTIPAATASALGHALADGYSPHWVISSVGSDPITVKNVLGTTPDTEPGSISFAELPASTDTNPWVAWTRKVILADKADFPSFTSSSTIDGNMAYGVGWGVSFAEALRAAGKNFTRASFVSTMLHTSFQTPALTPLKFTATNHQGLLGGYVTQIKSVTQTEPALGVDGKKAVYVTPGTKGSKVTKATRLSTAVPTWLH